MYMKIIPMSIKEKSFATSEIISCYNPVVENMHIFSRNNDKTQMYVLECGIILRRRGWINLSRAEKELLEIFIEIIMEKE